MMQSSNRKMVLMVAIAALCFVSGVAAQSNSQSRRQIKVVVESQQSGTQNQESLAGSGSVIIRTGNAYPSARIAGGDRETTVQRSTGIFTLVQDGAESILTVATKVPYNQTAYYYEYAAGAGYIQRQIVFTDVGTSLRVNASVLPDNQIRVRLTPRISYFSAERSGAIDFTEATTELVVPNGQPVSFGGSTTKMHEVTRQILGYRNTASTNEIGLTVTATIQ
jgi:predicted regulator of Ras-like GTPase activity (Roadblock/LC7/MglB family)